MTSKEKVIELIWEKYQDWFEDGRNTKEQASRSSERFELDVLIDILENGF